MTSKISHKSEYENNPFFVATNGITLLFNLARGVATIMVVISVLTFFSNVGPSDDPQKDAGSFVSILSGWTPEQWLLATGATLILSLAFVMLVALFGGVSSYTSAEIAKGKNVALGEAFRIAFNHLWSYVWLQVIIFVKLFLWTLLFIIPGIYMSFRYSLAGVAFYDSKKNLRGNAAIKESLRLTKNGWLTTFASNILFNLATFGVLQAVVTTGVNASLYRQFEAVGDKKPQAHWLSWLALFLPFILIIALFTFLIALVIGIAVGGSITS